MKTKKILFNILFWVTLITPMISFYLAGLIGETNIFGVFGLIRYSWIMLLFIPIPILMLFIANYLKKHKEKCRKYYIICFICLPLLIIFGSYRFVFYNFVTYQSSIFTKFENDLNIDLPNDIKIAMGKVDSYSLGYAKIQNNEEKREFEQNINNDDLWETKLSQSGKEILPIYVQHELIGFDYFLVYNSTSNEFNVATHRGDNVIFISYSCEGNRFIFLYDFLVR